MFLQIRSLNAFTACAFAFLLSAVFLVPVQAADRGDGQELSEKERQFQQSLWGAKLTGSFTVDDPEKQGKLHRETYTIERVTKAPNAQSTWIFMARVQYGERDVTVPIPLQVHWAGDTPVIMLTDLFIPGLGTYTARVLIFRQQYAGTWSGGNHGGKLFGEITQPLEAKQVGNIPNLHRKGTVFMSAQPGAEDLKALAAQGFSTVINLREADELKEFDEPATVKEAGMTYLNPGFRDPADLTDEVFDTVRKTLNDPANHPVLVHCASANRVGAVWLAHRVLDGGVSIEQAREEAKEVGLRTQAYEEKAIEYIEKQKNKKK